METLTAHQLLEPENSHLVEELSLLITSSFTKDPGTRYIFNNISGQKYIKTIKIYFRWLVRSCLYAGCTVTIIKRDSPQRQAVNQPTEPQVDFPPGATIRAAAITFPPGGLDKFESPITSIRAGFLGNVWTCGFSPMYKMFTQIMPEMEKAKKATFPDGVKAKFWMIMFLASHPDSQGQGFGKTLLEEVQRQVVEADNGKDSLPLYLESSSRGSQRLYRKVGFEDKYELSYGDLQEGDDWSYDKAGKIVGGKMFAMLWTPPKSKI